jgi:hypothetical protein
MYLNNLENIMNLLNQLYFFTFHAYVIKVVTFPLHEILIELNARKDEWIVVIKVLQEEKRTANWVARKGRKKISDWICGQYTNACKLKSPIYIYKELYKLITIILVF